MGQSPIETGLWIGQAVRPSSSALQTCHDNAHAILDSLLQLGVCNLLRYLMWILGP